MTYKYSNIAKHLIWKQGNIECLGGLRLASFRSGKEHAVDNTKSHQNNVEINRGLAIRKLSFHSGLKMFEGFHNFEKDVYQWYQPHRNERKPSSCKQRWINDRQTLSFGICVYLRWAVRECGDTGHQCTLRSTISVRREKGFFLPLTLCFYLLFFFFCCVDDGWWQRWLMHNLHYTRNSRNDSVAEPFFLYSEQQQQEGSHQATREIFLMLCLWKSRQVALIGGKALLLLYSVELAHWFIQITWRPALKSYNRAICTNGMQRKYLIRTHWHGHTHKTHTIYTNVDDARYE